MNLKYLYLNLELTIPVILRQASFYDLFWWLLKDSIQFWILIEQSILDQN